MGGLSAGSLLSGFIGATIAGIIAIILGTLQRRHDREVRLNEARIKAYGEMLGDSRMMDDPMLFQNQYGLLPGAWQAEIESRYLAWEQSGQRAMLLCTKRVHAALVEHREAVFNHTEALRARNFGKLNALAAIEREKHAIFFAEMRRELGVPWDDSACRLRKRGGGGKPKKEST